jgi:hypothetical protein
LLIAVAVERHLKVFDNLDFDVFSNQKWDRLKESRAEDIVVTWPDGHETKGIAKHIEDLKAPAAQVGEIAQTRAQFNVRRSTRAVADHLAIGGNEDAGPTLTHLQDVTQMNDSLALGGGPYHFFVRSSFSAAWSSIDSASNFFSLRFSSSSDRSHLASDTSMPPYLAFQLYSVASEMPCLRARSAVFAPASCSRKTAMICSSVNLIRFIVRPLPQAGL